MHSGDLSNLPNPFAPDSPSVWSRARLDSAVKMLAVVIVLFVLLLVASNRGPSWLAGRLSQGFSSLDSSAKQARLVQMSQLGVAGIEPMMAGLADEDPAVAEKTILLIRGLQTKWTTLPKAQADQNQLALITAIGNQAKTLPATQQAWLADVLNQSIVESVEVSDASSRDVFIAANNALSQMSYDNEAAALHSDGLVTSSPKSVSLRLPSTAPRPLPLSVATVESSWTDWPPAKPTIIQAGFLDETSQPVGRSAIEFAVQSTVPSVAPSAVTHTSVAASPDPAASVAMASLSMPNIAASDDVPQMDTGTPSESVDGVGEAAATVTTRFDELDTASIIKVLGSDQEVVRQQAEAHLKQRGFGDTELSVAIAIANSDPGYRIELISKLTTQQTIDSRPWLLLLLKDSDREVRVAAVSSLARMLDPQVRKELRLHLIEERDQKIVVRIRHALGLVDMEG